MSILAIVIAIVALILVLTGVQSPIFLLRGAPAARHRGDRVPLMR